MDNTNAAALARRLDVSLPTVHAILDREGVPRTGRGVARAVSAAVGEQIIRRRPAGFRATELQVLAALLVSPLGLRSARRVAEVAGISPTTASAVLARLAERGLVRHEQRRELRSGRGMTHTVWRLNARSREWSRLRSAIRAVRLPEPTMTPMTTVPRRFWHLFWNTDPARLRTEGDGPYIARRLLNSPSLAATQWALHHIPPADLCTAAAGRGTAARTAAMVHHWLGEPESA